MRIGGGYRLTSQAVETGAERLLADLRGQALEIVAEFAPADPGDATAFGLRLRCAPDGSEETSVPYEPAAQRLVVDR